MGSEMCIRDSFGGDPVHRLDIRIVFRIRHHWEIRKLISTDCTARCCNAQHARTGIAIATMTSLRLRPWRTRLVTTKLHCVCFVTTSHSNVNNVNYLSKLSAIVSHRGDICAISESKRPICPSPSTGLSAFRYRFLHAELGTGVFRSNASETSRADGSRTCLLYTSDAADE